MPNEEIEVSPPEKPDTAWEPFIHKQIMQCIVEPIDGDVNIKSAVKINNSEVVQSNMAFSVVTNTNTPIQIKNITSRNLTGMCFVGQPAYPGFKQKKYKDIGILGHGPTYVESPSSWLPYIMTIPHGEVDSEHRYLKCSLINRVGIEFFQLDEDGSLITNSISPERRDNPLAFYLLKPNGKNDIKVFIRSEQFRGNSVPVFIYCNEVVSKEYVEDYNAKRK